MIKIANFSPNSKNQDQFLATIALFEENFSIDWVIGLTKAKASDILSVLEEGVNEGWLIQKQSGIFSFNDLKKQRMLKDLLTDEEKGRLHRRIAEILLTESPDDDDILQIAVNHLLHITNTPEGCCSLLKAGNAYLKDFRNEDALKCYKKILSDLSGKDGQLADQIFAQTAIQYSKISTGRDSTIRVLSVLRDSLERVKRCNKRSLEALLEMHLAKNEWLRSKYEDAMRHFERGWSIAKEVDEPKLLYTVSTFHTFFLYWQGRFQEVIENYEKFVPDVEKYPTGNFPLLAALTLGHCYVKVGQITQGVGMLDSICRLCEERGDRYLASHARITIGTAMLEIGRIDDAFQHLESGMVEAGKEHNEWTRILAWLLLGYAYYLKREDKEAITYLQNYLGHSKRVQVTVQHHPYLLELYWAMEEGKLPPYPNVSPAAEIRQMTESENVFIKGVAYRYLYFLQKRKGLPSEENINLINLSIKFLEESGHRIELARSQVELAREYFSLGEEEKSKEATMLASKCLSSFNKVLGLPNDLRFLVEEPLIREDPIKEILKLSQEMVVIRDNKELVQHIISTVNQLTGAERGAIFLLDENTNPPRLNLRASRNFTLRDIADKSFHSSMKLIEEVITTGKGRMVYNGLTDSNVAIRSCLCVPMIFKDRVVGALYHDNQLLGNAFRESDLELFGFFAALAAFALDNARAYDEIEMLNKKLLEEKQYYEEQHLQAIHFGEIVGESPSMMRVLAQVGQVAPTDTTVLVTGETGVGKELIARAIHHHSPRCEGPFIRIHCSALPESLIASELFGHEKGAFTGASRRRIGRFELADGGTLFLDEIGDLPAEVQVRLLRVLQFKEFERVGGSDTIKSDYRLVAATNRDLDQEVKETRFRKDLLYRFNVFPIHVPALRERKEDILLLANYFLQVYGKKIGKPIERIPKEEMDKLIQYDWPGNVRELENIIERGVILNSGPALRVPELGAVVSTRTVDTVTLKDNERRHILWALQKTRWKVRGLGGAADLLDIHPSTLAFRMKKLGISRAKVKSL